MGDKEQDKIDIKVVDDFLTKEILPKLLGTRNILRQGKEILAETKLISIHDKIVSFMRRYLKHEIIINFNEKIDPDNNENNKD